MPYFHKHPDHRELVLDAIDKAIKEIAKPVMDRAVHIACITTKELVVKDFSCEPNEV